MFKALYFLVVCYLIVLTNAAPLDKDSEAKILSSEYTIYGKGNYRFSFKTSNGMTREETGSIFSEGQPDEHIVVTGRYTYFNTEGKEVIVEYTAGENGFNVLPPRPINEMTVLALPPTVVGTLLGK